MEFFLQKCLLSSPLHFICLLSKSVYLLVVGAAKRVNSFKKCLKILFSENIWRMKPKLGILAYDITLYKRYGFFSGRMRTLVAMATYSFHRLIMGKVEIDNFCQVIGDI